MTCLKAEDNMHEEGGGKGNDGEVTVTQVADEVLMDNSERKHGQSAEDGLQNLVARNEDEYVESAIQLASDVTSLSNLRMSLRELMSKSPLCDGTQFTQNLESIYRSMWHRYCDGDVPSLRRIGLLQQQQQTQTEPVVPEESTVNSVEKTMISASKDGSIKENGFTTMPPVVCNNSTGEEKVPLNQNSNPGS